MKVCEEEEQQDDDMGGHLLTFRGVWWNEVGFNINDWTYFKGW